MRGRAAAGAADQGSAGVLTALAILLLALCACVGALVGSVLVLRTKVATAADLGALAAAQAALAGPTPACARAAAVVEANGGRLESCALTGAMAQVVVSAPAPAQVARLHPGGATVRARARAELVGPDEGLVGVSGDSGRDDH